MVKNVLKKNEKRRKNNKGFSLVELIVVIAIMAVLVGVLAPQFIKYVESSRQSTDMQNVENLKNAIEAEAADNESLATASIVISSGAVSVTLPTGVTISSAKTSFNLKSSTWPDQTYTYTTSTGSWSNGECENTSNPMKNMKTIFE